MTEHRPTHHTDQEFRMPHGTGVLIGCVVGLVLWSVLVVIFLPILRHWST